jgi:two-component system, cell cycle response regulator
MNERVAETWVTMPSRGLTAGRLEACLIHIYPRGSSIGRRYPLGASTLVLGRGEGCDIRIQDNSVSRKHAQIEPTTDDYVVQDLGSTNGTFVNDMATTAPRRLKDGDYLRVGNCIYRFLTGGNIESEYHEEIYRLTIIDGLTRVHNHRYLIDFLDREVARSVRHGRPLSVMLFDIDKFKAVNDEHGHLCGDYVLRELSERLRHAVRREDLLARYGGEEFAQVLVETDRDQALIAAERVRRVVAETPFQFESRALPVTVSVGVATTCGEGGMTSAGLLKAADDKLYAAKRAGRNRVVA